jgi:hypothetical protein
MMLGFRNNFHSLILVNNQRSGFLFSFGPKNTRLNRKNQNLRWLSHAVSIQETVFPQTAASDNRSIFIRANATFQWLRRPSPCHTAGEG